MLGTAILCPFCSGAAADGLGTPVSTVRTGVACVSGNPAGLVYIPANGVVMDILPPFGTMASDFVDCDGIAAHAPYGRRPGAPSSPAPVPNPPTRRSQRRQNSRAAGTCRREWRHQKSRPGSNLPGLDVFCPPGLGVLLYGLEATSVWRRASLGSRAPCSFPYP